MKKEDKNNDNVEFHFFFNTVSQRQQCGGKRERQKDNGKYHEIRIIEKKKNNGGEEDRKRETSRRTDGQTDRKKQYIFHALIHLLVADGGVDFVDVGGEGFEFDLLRILNEVRIGQVPALGHVQVFVRVHEQIEGAGRLLGEGEKRI